MAKKNGATFGSQIDLLYSLQQKRLAFQKKMEEKIAEMKAEEQAIEDDLINKYTKEQIDQMRGSKATASLSNLPMPTVEDWDKFYAHIKKTGEFDLLEKRPAKAAYRERLEAKETIPGVKTFWKKSISLREVA
jgi:hypothetical protein